MRYLVFIITLFAALQTNAQNNIVYGAGINYTNGAPTFTPPVRTSRVAIDTVTGKWYHFNTPGGWQLIGNTIEEIAGCTAPAYTPGKGDSKVVINNCSPQPELYFYNGSAWVLVGGGSVYAGEGIRIENDTIILDSLNFLDFRTGNALDGDVGRVQWNDTDGTLDLNLKGGNVTLQIGQEEVSLVKHADNSGLIEGRVVYIVGSDGANKTVRYAKADSDATSATTFGLMTESASGGGKAFCTTFGLVRDLNTTNLTEGGIVWLSADTAGTMTAVRPTAPDHGVMIGFCVRKHATQGAIFVQVQNGYELNELHDVFVPSPTNGQVLTWNSTNARWEAITPANQLQTLSTDGSAGNISISSGNTITLNVNDADASTTNELQTLSVGTNTLTLSNGGGTVTVDTDPSTDVTGSGAAGQVSFWTGAQTQAGDNNLFWDNANKRLGVGTASPSHRLQILGPSTRFENSSGNFELDIVGGGTTSRILTTATGMALGTLSNNALVFWVNATERMRINSSTGHVGINQTAPAARLHVVGSGASSTTWTAQFHNSGGSNNALMIRDDGNVGIGTSSLTAQLNVKSRPTNAPLTVRDSADNIVFSTNNSRTTFFGSNDGYNGTVDINLTNHASRVAKIGALEFTRGGGPSWTGQGLRIDGPNRTFIFNVSNGNTTDLSAFALSAGAALQNVGFSSRTSGTIDWMLIENASYRPTSGTGVFNQFTIKGEIQQTGGANGVTRGVYVQPTITSAANWRSFEFSNNAGWGFYGAGNAKNYFAGNTAIGTTSQDASAAFEVASTTQGVLFPRMTTTQRNAIATPADGLVIYNTTDNKLQVRAAGAWVDLH